MPALTLCACSSQGVVGGTATSPASTVLTEVLSNPVLHVHLPFGQGLDVLLRFSRLYRIRCVDCLLFYRSSCIPLCLSFRFLSFFRS